MRRFSSAGLVLALISAAMALPASGSRVQSQQQAKQASLAPPLQIAVIRADQQALPEMRLVASHPISVLEAKYGAPLDRSIEIAHRAPVRAQRHQPPSYARRSDSLYRTRTISEATAVPLLTRRSLAMRTIAWALRHPLYAGSWYFRGKPYSAT